MNHPWVKKEIKKDIKDFLKFNKNEGTMYPNIWENIKAMLRGKIIALSTYIKRVEKSPISDLTANMKALEQKEADSPGGVDDRK